MQYQSPIQNQNPTTSNNFSKVGINDAPTATRPHPDGKTNASVGEISLSSNGTAPPPGMVPMRPADDGVIDLFDFDGVLCLDRSGRVTSEVKSLINKRRSLHPITIVSRREKDSIYSKAIYDILELEGIRHWFSHIIIKDVSKREHISEIKAIYGEDKHYILYDDTQENIRDCSAVATCILVDGKIGLKEHHFKREEDAIILYPSRDEKQQERIMEGKKNHRYVLSRRRVRMTPNSKWQRILYGRWGPAGKIREVRQ